ncbi:MAG: HAMP domain-containing protein, partial [FCB group bacterium]|nr:HAMP domain-containing protein [FCB group bacterium]
MFKNLKISTKLYIGFGLVVFLGLVLAGTNYFSYASIRKSTVYSQEEEYPVLKKANELILVTTEVQQACVTIAATRGQGGLDDGLDIAKEYADTFNIVLGELIKLDPKHKDQLEKLQEPFKKYYETGIRLANAYIQNGTESGNEILPEFDSEVERIDNLINKYYHQAEKSFDSSMGHIEDKTVSSSNIGIIIALLAALLGVGIAFYITKMISNPINKITAAAKEIAKGDVEQSIQIDSKDEIGQLANAFRNLIDYIKEVADVADHIAQNDLTVEIEPKSSKDVLGNSFKQMIVNLTQMIRQLTDNARELSSASTEVASASEQMSKGAEDQAQQVGQISVAIEEMTATIVEASRNASEATNTAKNANDTA